MQPVGIARTEINIIDLSVLINTGLKGITGVMGATERGPVNTPTLIGSWIEYQRVFGGLLDTKADSWYQSDFPLLCKRALEAGAKLMISRVAHYTDITDSGTIDGVKASALVTRDAVSAVSAKGALTVTAAGTALDDFEIFVNGVSIGAAIVPNTPTTTTTAQAAVNAINAATGTNGGYTATLTNPNIIVIIAPSSLGAAANALPITYASPSVTATVSTALAGGVTAVTLSEATFTAKSIGAWGNTVTVSATAAFSGLPNKFDLTVSLAGYPELTQVVRDIPLAPTNVEVEQLNASLKYVDVAFDTEMFAFSATLLTLGDQYVDEIQLIDYIGDAGSETGIHAFDSKNEITKICAPEKAIPELDIALVAYADTRKDILAITRVASGLDGQGAIDYREGVLSSTSAINSWRGLMIFGDHYITHPTTGVKRSISVIGDILGLFTQKDNNQAEWFSAAGPKRGRLRNTLGMVYNLGTAARETLASSVDVHGVNMVIEHDTFGVVLWGNSTLQKENTLLKNLNVAELMVFLTRSLKPLVESEYFDPNDIQTWKNIYRRVQPFMEFLKSNRAIWDYLYQGDQDIDKIEDAVVNQPENIDAGQYKFNLLIKPKVALKYIEITIAVTNSGASFELTVASI